MTQPRKFARPMVAISIGAAIAVLWWTPGGGVGAANAPPDARVSTVVYPAQSLPLTFSHQAHLGRGARCVTCHTAAPTSKSALDNLIPREAACKTCHPIERDKPNKTTPPGTPPAECAACHQRTATGQIARVRVPPPNLKFDHAAHVGRGQSCNTCHGDLLAQKVDLATRAQLPSMRSCMGCHDGRSADDRCTTCHFAAPGGFVRTEHASGSLIPSGTLRGDAHGPAFATSHGAVAQGDATYCQSCHRQEFCSECHSGTAKPMSIHGGDYIARHAIDAVRDQPKCSSCHRAQTFCVGCHARVGLGGGDRGGFAGQLAGAGDRYHPVGWVEFSGGTPVTGARGPNHHAFAAQRNIAECQSCHREDFCQKCHSSQPRAGGAPGFGINPHPRGWAGSARCRSLLQRNPRVCTRCHVALQELTCRAR